MNREGRADFYARMLGRKAPYFSAFDVFSINGADLRELSLLTRKSRLFEALSAVDSRVRDVDYIYEELLNTSDYTRAAGHCSAA